MRQCNHSWTCAGNKLRLDTILNDWLGPTLALTSCQECLHPALLYLVSWRGPNLSERIYGIRSVEPSIRDTYVANIARDYCDLDRKELETQAFINACTGNAWLVLVNLPGIIVDSVFPGSFNPPVRPWQDIKPDTHEDWIKHLTGSA